MSQAHVERVVGRLVTDESFRLEFARDPVAALQGIRACGVELTDIETRALANLDPRRIARFAETLDPRLLKCCLKTPGEDC